jgi:hypothetical protein
MTQWDKLEARASTVFLVLLIIAAAFSAIAIAFPKSVMFGYYFFILPGVLLQFAPTVLVWLVCCGGVWIVARNFAPRFPLLLGNLMLGAFLLWVVPSLTHKEARDYLAKVHRDDITPTEKVKLSGRVQISSEFSRVSTKDKIDCNRVCLDILFHKRVTSVVVTKDLTLASLMAMDPVKSREFVLAAQGKCNGPNEVPLRPDEISELAPNYDDKEALQAARANALGAGTCIVVQTPSPGRADVSIARVIVKSGAQTHAVESNWLVQKPFAGSVTSFEIFDKNAILLARKQTATAYVTRAPLVIWGVGGTYNDLAWESSTLTKPTYVRPFSFLPSNLMSDFTDLSLESQVGFID